MSNLTLLLNQYQAAFSEIQESGSRAYESHTKNATTIFKYARESLADSYGSLLIGACKHESNFRKPLYLIHEVCDTLSKIPVREGSEATVLVTFSYSFLRMLNNGIWGFPKHAADLIYQQECSDKIIHAVCGKQLLETKAGVVSPNEVVVCIALEYLFICQDQGILSSNKYANAIKSIDVHFRLNPNILKLVLDSLFDRLSSVQEQRKFLVLIDGVIAQFTNENIKRVLSSFKQNKTLTHYVVELDSNVMPITSDTSSVVVSDIAESFDGSETYEPTKPHIAFLLENSEKIAPMKKEKNPYGAIGTPVKKSNAPTPAAALVLSSIPVATPSVEIKNSPVKLRYDLNKIIWGVLSDTQRVNQINEFKAFIKTLKNSEESVRLAIQFLILNSNNDQDLLCPTYREKAVELIVLGTEHIDIALNNIYLALTNQEDKAAFIKILSKISNNFNSAKYIEVKNRFVGFKPAVEEAVIPTPPREQPESKKKENGIIWGVPGDDKVREQQIEYFKKNLLSGNGVKIDASIALQFIILLKKGAETISAPTHWPLVMNTILRQDASVLSKAISSIEEKLMTPGEKINFIRILRKVAYSFNAGKYSDYHTVFSSYRKDLQVALKAHDENIIFLRKLDRMNVPALKTYRDELFAKNNELSELINKYLLSDAKLPDTQMLFKEIKNIQDNITSRLGKLDSENNNNAPKNFSGCHWKQGSYSVNTNHKHTEGSPKLRFI